MAAENRCQSFLLFTHLSLDNGGYMCTPPQTFVLTNVNQTQKFTNLLQKDYKKGPIPKRNRAFCVDYDTKT